MKKMILIITLFSFLSLSAQEDPTCILISKYYNKYLKINKKEGFYTIHDTILKVTYAKVDNKLAFFTSISEMESDGYYLTTNKINNYLNEDSAIVSEVEAISKDNKQVRIIFTEESFAISDDEIEYRYLYYEKKEKMNVSKRNTPKVKAQKK
jgi:hypothetical protein